MKPRKTTKRKSLSRVLPKEVLAVIPEDLYCHGELVKGKDGHYRSETMCPFWFKLSNRKEHESGFCVLIGKGDYEINREPHVAEWTSFDKNNKISKKWKVKHGPNNPDSSSLLWDQCKELGCPKYGSKISYD